MFLHPRENRVRNIRAPHINGSGCCEEYYRLIRNGALRNRKSDKSALGEVHPAAGDPFLNMIQVRGFLAQEDGTADPSASRAPGGHFSREYKLWKARIQGADILLKTAEPIVLSSRNRNSMAPSAMKSDLV